MENLGCWGQKQLRHEGKGDYFQKSMATNRKKGKPNEWLHKGSQWNEGQSKSRNTSKQGQNAKRDCADGNLEVEKGGQVSA